MKKGLKRSLKVAAGVLGALLLILVVGALLVLFHKPFVRNVLQAQIAKRTGLAVRIGRLDYRFFPLRITADSLAVGLEDAFLKADLDLGRLEVRGHLGKLVRGEIGALDRMVLEGFEIRYTEKAVNPEPVDLEAILRQTADLLVLVDRIEMTGGRVSASVLGQTVELENVRLDLAAPGEDGGGRSAVLECGAFHAGAMDGSYSVDGGLRLAAGISPGGVTAVNLRAAVLAPSISAAGIEAAFGSLLLEADAIWEMAEGRISVSRLSAGVPGLLEITGAAAAVLKGRTSLDVFATMRVDDIERAAGLLKDRLPPEFRGTAVSGRAGVEIHYALAGSAAAGTRDLKASVRLEGMEIGHEVSGIPVRVKLDGGLEINGLPPAVSVSADVRASLAGLSVDRVRIGPSVVNLRGRATPDAAHIDRFLIEAEGLTLPVAEGRELGFERTSLAGRASINLRRKAVDIPSLQAVLPPLPPMVLFGQVELGGRRRGDIRVEVKGLDIPVLRDFLGAFVPPAFAEWGAGGTFDLAARAAEAEGPDEAWDLSADLTFTKISFNDASFTIAGEDLSPALHLNGTWSPARGDLPFSVTLALDRGESLFKSFYVSWAKHPIEATFSGRYEAGPAALNNLQGRILLPTIGRVDLSGSARAATAPSFDLRGEARLALAPFYSLYSQAAVAEESRMRLEGDLTAECDLVSEENGGLTVRGRIGLAGTALENPSSKMIISGISADIPVHVVVGPSAAEAPAGDFTETGALRIGKLQSPVLTLEELDIGLEAGANAYLIKPARIGLFGGHIELGATTVRFDPGAGTVHGLGSLALRDLDVARFPIASPQFKLTGFVRAEFPRLDFTAERIAIAGRGEVDIFGGQIVLRDLAVDRPFDEGRAISLNVDLVNLDLKKLTDEVPFGEVTGIVRGEIRDLVLSYGQPERFDFRLESFRHRGVPQTFSLKAVDNLTVLSSGERASGGTSQFWMRFIRGFHYEKLGIVSTLRNDTFTLNGTIHEGGVEYLVKKPPLFGISVVNRMPDKVISFREMMGRLKRVGQSEK